MSKKDIVVENLSLLTNSDNNDAGETFEFLCPKCSEKLVVASHQWWRTNCQCGITWHLSLAAVGTQD